MVVVLALFAGSPAPGSEYEQQHSTTCLISQVIHPPQCSAVSSPRAGVGPALCPGPTSCLGGVGRACNAPRGPRRAGAAPLLPPQRAGALEGQQPVRRL